MRKVSLICLLSAIFLGVCDDSYALKPQARIKRKKSTTSGTANSSSTQTTTTTTTDWKDSSSRFSSQVYSTTLSWDEKGGYSLDTILLPSPRAYYRANGSDAINEKFCFGPYLELVGLDPFGLSSDEKIEDVANGYKCVTLEKGYEYYLRPYLPQKKGKDDAAEKSYRDALSAMNNSVRRAMIYRGDDTLLSQIQFDVQRYFDVNNYVNTLKTKIQDVKTSCGALKENMDGLAGALWTQFGLDAGGAALSGASLAFGLVNSGNLDEAEDMIKNVDKQIIDAAKEYCKCVDSSSSSLKEYLTGDYSSVQEVAQGCFGLNGKKKSDGNDICASDSTIKFNDKPAEPDSEAWTTNDATTLETKLKNKFAVSTGEDIAEEAKKNNKKIKSAMSDSKTSAGWQMWLNIGSAATSAGSIVSSSIALGIMGNAKDNLEKCQSDTKNLEKLLGQYKTDIGEGDY